MDLFNSYKTPFEKEWDSISRREIKFINGRIGKKDSIFNGNLSEKVPDKLQNTLNKAFEKAFVLVFEKGTDLIEKTYNKDNLKKSFKVNMKNDRLYNNKKTLHVFNRNANITENLNVALSGVSGIGMGLLGVGILDIPIFIGMVMKSMYEISLNYGFNYTSEKEKYFMLLIIEGAVSYGDKLIKINKAIEDFSRNGGVMPDNFDLNEQISETSNALSKELLYMKFLQSVPVVGVVGGTYDLIYMSRILEYANIKYQKRFLRKYEKEHKKGL